MMVFIVANMMSEPLIIICGEVVLMCWNIGYIPSYGSTTYWVKWCWVGDFNSINHVRYMGSEIYMYRVKTVKKQENQDFIVKLTKKHRNQSDYTAVNCWVKWCWVGDFNSINHVRYMGSEIYMYRVKNNENNRKSRFHREIDQAKIMIMRFDEAS